MKKLSHLVDRELVRPDEKWRRKVLDLRTFLKRNLNVTDKRMLNIFNINENDILQYTDNYQKPTESSIKHWENAIKNFSDPSINKKAANKIKKPLSSTTTVEETRNILKINVGNDNSTNWFSHITNNSNRDPTNTQLSALISVFKKNSLPTKIEGLSSSFIEIFDKEHEEHAKKLVRFATGTRVYELNSLNLQTSKEIIVGYGLTNYFDVIRHRRNEYGYMEDPLRYNDYSDVKADILQTHENREYKANDIFLHSKGLAYIKRITLELVKNKASGNEIDENELRYLYKTLINSNLKKFTPVETLFLVLYQFRNGHNLDDIFEFLQEDRNSVITETCNKFLGKVETEKILKFMKEKKLLPNRVTYLYLIEEFTKDKNIKEIIKICDFIVFHSCINLDSEVLEKMIFAFTVCNRMDVSMIIFKYVVLSSWNKRNLACDDGISLEHKLLFDWLLFIKKDVQFTPMFRHCVKPTSLMCKVLYDKGKEDNNGELMQAVVNIRKKFSITIK